MCTICTCITQNAPNSCLLFVFFPPLCRVLRRSCLYSTQCTCMCIRFAFRLCARHIPNELRLGRKRKQTWISAFTPLVSNIKAFQNLFFPIETNTHTWKDRRFTSYALNFHIKNVLLFFITEFQFIFPICIHLSRRLIFFNEKYV